MLVEGLQEVKDDADQKDQAFRTTLNGNNDMLSEAINQVAVSDVVQEGTLLNTITFQPQNKLKFLSKGK